MTPVIRIDDQVMDELKKRAIALGLVFEPPNTTLRRVLGLDVKIPINLEKKTPEEAYRRPILEALYELGGSASVDDVLKVVERKMKPLLKEVDYQKVPSGKEIRWRNTAKWERSTLVKEGLLKSKSESPKGVWELSEKGGQELEQMKDENL